ncbi:TIGR00289 family protein, partial [Methanosarcinales archaeon]
FIFTSIAAYGLDASWLGKIITSYEVDKLVELNNKININIAGEGGEFESLVLDCPLFNKHLTIKEYEIKEIDDYTATMIINRAELN